MLFEEWVKPMTGAGRMGPRKHTIETSLFSTMSILRCNAPLRQIEHTARQQFTGVGKHFLHNVRVINKVLHEFLVPLTDTEKDECRGKIPVAPNVIYLIDGMDVPVMVRKNAWMYRTHKDNMFIFHPLAHKRFHRRPENIPTNL